MQITLFGAVWTAILIFCFLSNDHRRILFLALLAMIFQCNNILVLGGTGIGTQIFTVCAACVRFLLVRKSSIKSKRLSMLSFCVAALLLAVVLSLLVNNLLSKTMIGLVMLAVYSVFVFMLRGKNVRINERWLEKTEDIIIITVLVVGVLQVLCKSGVGFLSAPLRVLFYNDVNNTDVIFNHKALNRLYSTFMEPSYCGAFLVGSFALIVLRKKLSKKNVFLALAVVVAILLTRSSAAFGGLAIVVCLLLIARAKKKVFKFLLPAFILGALFVCVFNMDLLNEVIFEKVNTSSFAVRNNWNKIALRSFEESPWFGTGYNSVRASSLVHTLLAEIGIVGSVAYLLLTVVLLKWAVFHKADNESKGRSFCVLGIIVCQFIACPDLNFSPFWLALYLLALSLRLDSMPAPQKEGVTHL